nr:hypothetical protein [Spirochaetota bacterium]
GFFQLNSDGNKNFDFEKDMYRYSYGPNKMTDFILGGPEFTSYADMQLKPRADNKYTHKTIYELVLVFRDGLFQENSYTQMICVDGTPPKIAQNGFSPDIKDPFDFNPEIIVTFDEDIGYADSSSLTLDPAHGKIKLKSISKNQAFFSVTGLKALSDYSATVRRVKDIAGNVMEDSAPFSFTTISGDLQIKDDKANTNFAAYRGFEESSLNLKAYFKNGEINITQVALSVESPSNGVSVDSAGKVTINPRDLTNEDDVTVKIKAYQSSTEETSYYTVTIKSWYEIYSATRVSDLEMLRNNLNGRFRLMDNIEIDGNMDPIGSFTNGDPNKPFTGIFDGNDKTLSNFNIQADKNSAGLFAVNKGTIKNLNVLKASFNIGIIDYVGIICGRNEGIIDDCDVSNSNINGRSVIGIICGQNYTGTVSNCDVSDISISAVGSAGGIVGSNNGVIETCTSATASSKDISTTSANAGGIAGVAFGGKISNSSSTAVVNSPNGDNIGGIAGWVNSNSSNNEITDCHHTIGKVSGKSSVGGLIGRTGKVSISGCDSSNEVISTSQYTGGLIGYASDVSILNCSSTSNVQGAQSTGGLLGYLESVGSISKVSIDNCHHNGDSVTGTS